MSVPSNLTPLRLTQMQQYLGSDTNGTIYYVLGGVSYQAQLSTLFSAVGGGTVTSVDVSGGTTGLSFSGGPITLSGTITAGGTLNIANGGTGAATAAGARVNILPSLSGNAGKVMAVNGGETDVEFVPASDGTVTSVDASGGTTGLSFSGGPVTASGTLTLAGTLEMASGGTGAGSASGARMNLLPSYAANGGKVLAVNAGATDTEWITVGGSGTVTSVNVSGGSTGLSFSGGPVTGAGTITAAGTLAVASGGTGQTSFTNGQLLIGNTTGNTLAKATLTGGSGIAVTNGAGSITLATPVTSTGDLILGNGSNSATRLAIGSDGHVLTSNGTTAEWAAPAPAGGWAQIGATLTTTGAGPWDFTSIPDTYADLLLTINLTVAGTGAVQIAVSPDGVSWSASVTISAAAISDGAGVGGAMVPNYSGNEGAILGGVRELGASPAAGLGSESVPWICTGGIAGLRISISTGSADPVSISLYGR